MLRRVTAPAALLISLSEAKAHVREDSDDNDTLLTRLIGAVTAHLDGYSGILGRCLITQTWALDLPAFPAGHIEVPLPPLQSVSEIVYRDANDDEQTLASSNYIVHPGPFGTVELIDGGTWPDTGSRRNAVTVEFVAGYGDAATDVPEAIRHAALLLLGHWYENREPSDVPPSVAYMLKPFKADWL